MLILRRRADLTCRRRSSSTHGWARLPGASATNDAGTRRRGAGSVAGLCWRTSYPLGLQRAPRSSAQRTLAGGCRHRKPVTDRSSGWKRGRRQRSASQRVRDSGAVMRRDAWANCSTASRAVAEGSHGAVTTEHTTVCLLRAQEGPAARADLIPVVVPSGRRVHGRNGPVPDIRTATSVNLRRAGLRPRVPSGINGGTNDPVVEIGTVLVVSGRYPGVALFSGAGHCDQSQFSGEKKVVITAVAASTAEMRTYSAPNE